MVGVAFSLTDDPFPQSAYNALPQWLRDTIAQSPEYGAEIEPKRGSELALGALRPVNDLDDDIPF